MSVITSGSSYKKRALVMFSCALVLCASGAYATRAEASACPCDLWPTSTPSGIDSNDSSSVELGLKFTTDRPGYITGLRFYKSAANTGVHKGNLWDAAGNNLASVTFSGESATGWQQALFAFPVAVTASTTYTISYFAPVGRYSFDSNFFQSATDVSPLHAPSSSMSGGNGVYTYGSSSSFPASTYNATNYWVDPIFDDTAIVSKPVVTSFTAAPASIISGQGSALSWVTQGAVSVSIDSGVGVVSGNSKTVYPATSTTYVLSAVNSAGTTTASVTVAVSTPPLPTPNPILVVTSGSNQFASYYQEILHAEGLNEFSSADITVITPSVLSGFNEVVIGDFTLTPSQVTMFSDWVQAGGNLIVMHPGAQLSSLLGLTYASSTLADGYLRIDTTQAPGAGIVSSAIQYHGTAGSFTLNGARAIATLYSSATTPTPYPAVTTRQVGAGTASAFLFDLARSVVYTRQGNPAWAGQERDNDPAGPIIRADDMMYPDYLDLNNVAIPQADEMQRLFANMLISQNLTTGKTPLPRFWYFPSMDKAVIVAAGDDHATSNGTKTVFDEFIAASPTGCSVGDWACYRATSWIYANTPLSSAAANQYESQGFDIGDHVSTGCANYSSLSQLNAFFTGDLQSFASVFPGLPAQTGNRTHCIPWSDWSSTPKAELAHGIRFDMGYYYWPDSWVQNRPGFMNGSGIPMRYADTDGTTLDVYQQASHMVNESGETWPAGIEAMINGALGAQGYYGAFGTHYDYRGDGFPEMLLASAQAHHVPIVSAQQMLTWVDGRNASSFSGLSWNGTTLSFTVNAAAGARNAYALLPSSAGGNPVSAITFNGATLAFATSTIKGVQYVQFPAVSGSYSVTYAQPAPDTVAPTVPQGVTASPVSQSQVNVSWSASTDLSGVAGYHVFRGSVRVATTTALSFADTGLVAATQYSYAISAFDASGNESATSAVVATTTLAVPPQDTTPPTVASVIPSSASSGVVWNTPITVRFSEAMNPASIGTSTIQLLNASGTPVAATVAYVASTTSAVLTPTSALGANMTYTVKVLGGSADPRVKDVAGNALAATVTSSFTTLAQQTLWASATTPATPSAPDSAAVEIGVKFKSDVAGKIYAIRFYKGSGNTGTHIVHLWSSTGTKLATATASGETASGWQQVTLTTPIAITAGTTYIASYRAPVGHYAGDNNYFGVTGTDSGVLHAPSSAASGGNGVYIYTTSSSGAFPNSSYQATNYWVDVVLKSN